MNKEDPRKQAKELAGEGEPDIWYVTGTLEHGRFESDGIFEEQAEAEHDIWCEEDEGACIVPVVRKSAYDAQRQRADAAEASAAAMRETVAWCRRCASPGSHVQRECDKALATDAGATLLAEVERLRKFVAKMRKLIPGGYTADVELKEALAALDQAAQPAEDER